VGARPRRRRRPAPRRRVRRWLRRQDRFTRFLLVSVVLLSAVVAALFFPLLNEDRRRQGPEVVAKDPAQPGVPRQRTRTAAPAASRPHRVAATASAPAPAPAAPPHAAPPAPAPATAPATPPTPPRVAAAVPARPPARDAALPVQPRAAIVIDDLGQRLEHLEQIERLELPVSIAVIPGLPATARTVDEAARRGIEMLLHQPMEPREEGGKNAGAGVLLVAMSPGELTAQLRRGFDAVPGAVGVNNHMGSRFTEDASALALVMPELKSRGLFWLDSRTSPATRGAAAARAAGVPAIERDVFLDADRDPAFIRSQLRLLLQTARRRGTAVGIGHPHPETLAALLELRAELLASGVALVPVSQLVPPSSATVAALDAAAHAAPAGRPPARAATATP
jgi:polysaccharide deacetylase 2 family uncharacterized protein YibQ